MDFLSGRLVPFIRSRPAFSVVFGIVCTCLPEEDYTEREEAPESG